MTTKEETTEEEQTPVTTTPMAQDASKSGTKSPPERIRVLLPDMFQSFLAVEPKVNPLYEIVKAESEAWINEKCDFDDRMRNKIIRCDFSYFISICAPEAGLEELKTMCDWGNWIFPWDDSEVDVQVGSSGADGHTVFDEGDLKDDPKQAEQIMDSLLSIMRGRPSDIPKSALVDFHDTVWDRIVKNSPLGIQTRFHKTMEDYCKGVLDHVFADINPSLPTAEEELEVRRQSAGVTPLYALIEYAEKLDIPGYVFEHPSIKKIEILGAELVALQNDTVSYLKEEALGTHHNVVALWRLRGLSAQKSFNNIDYRLKACYRNWYLALADLPQWGETVDRQVYKYIQGVQNVVKANLNWSFKTYRYFGSDHGTIRKTRLIHVLERLEKSVEEEPKMIETVAEA